MKTVLSFLFGVAVGAVGAVLWLHKDIKKELEDIRSNGPTEPEVPFTCGEGNDTTNEPNALRSEISGITAQMSNIAPPTREEKVAYNKIINDVKTGTTPPVPIPVMEREESPFDRELREIAEQEELEEPDGFDIIDRETYDSRDGFIKDRLVYYTMDKIMCTEAGSIIPTPATLVGPNWEVGLGVSSPHESFVRNFRLKTDFEIYVEEGLYTDEYGEYIFEED